MFSRFASQLHACGGRGRCARQSEYLVVIRFIITKNRNPFPHIYRFDFSVLLVYFFNERVWQGVIPRAAALLDAGALTDVIGVSAVDTFARPIYAGNALATVKSADKIKVRCVVTRCDVVDDVLVLSFGGFRYCNTARHPL